MRRPDCVTRQRRYWTVWPALLIACAAVGCGRADTSSPEPASWPRAQLPTEVTPLGYRLRLDIDPTRAEFSGHVEIDVVLASALDAFWIHARDIAAQRVVLHQAEAIDASLDQVSADGVARVELDAVAQPGPATLTIEYTAPYSAGAEGLYRVRIADDWYVFSQFEPLDARRAFPAFDEPGYKVPFEITLRGRAEDVLVTSAPEISRSLLPDGRIEVKFARTPKLPTYLLAFAVGPLDVVEGGHSGGVPIRGLAARGRGAGLARALADTPALVARLEEYFGVPYPFAKLDIIAVPGQMGAMENVGLITYAEELILLDDDAPLAQLRAYASVHLHELAHQWFGNLVTMRWWDDLWLNEAFASWIAGRLVEAWHPEFAMAESAAAAVTEAMDVDSLESARRIREPIETFNDVVNAFDDITYTKGAAVLGMLERHVGEAAFRAGIQRHMQRYAYASADAEELARSVAEASGSTDLPGVLQSFIEQAGVPELSVDIVCPPQADEGPALLLSQARYLPLGSRAVPAAAWHVPVCARVPESPPICQVMTEPTMRLALPGGCPAWVLPNAAAAGYYRFNLAEEELANLMTAPAGALSTLERIAVADSLEAGVRAGRISIAALLDQAPAFAASDTRELVTAPVRLWSRLQEVVLEGDALERSRARLQQVYRPVLARLRGQGDLADPLLLRDVVHVLALAARDPEVRADLAARTAAYVGLAETPDPVELPRDWLSIAFRVAAEDRGLEFPARFAVRLEQTEDALTRTALLRGIGAAADPTLARSLLEGNSLLGAERYVLVDALLDRDRIDLNTDWFLAHVASLRERYPAFGHAGLVLPFGVHCDRARARAVEAAWRPLVAKLEGGPRALDQTLESIELCAALVERQGPDLRAYFAED